MSATQRRKILILCKTYPNPSSKYIETSCVAGMDEDGNLIRLFPIPFRLIDGDKQFRKWQWIEAVIKKSNDDHRPESYKLSVDTILAGQDVSTRDNWKDRRYYLNLLKPYTNFKSIERDQALKKTSLALLRPKSIVRLEIVETRGGVYKIISMIGKKSLGRSWRESFPKKIYTFLWVIFIDFKTNG